MSTVRVQVHAGEPTDISLCPRCSHVSLCAFPLTGLAESGVVPLGSVTACAECGSAADAVSAYLARRLTPLEEFAAELGIDLDESG